MKRILTALLCASMLLGLCACGQPASAAAGTDNSAAVTVSGERDSYTLAWSEMQNADFWIALADDPQTVRMTAEEIDAYNAAMADIDATAVEDLDSWPESLSKSQLQALVNSYAEAPGSDQYTPSGPVTTDVQAAIRENRNTGAIADQNPVRYGFVTTNSILRRFPSALPIYNRANDVEFDRAAETFFRIWEPVLVLHTSADGQWNLVQAYDYLGWLPAESTALCDKAQWDDLRGQLKQNCLTVTAARLALEGSFYTPAQNGVVLKMGTHLPLLSDRDSVDNAAVLNCYVVQLPQRDENGRLTLNPARIPMYEDVCKGVLPYTTENVLRQSFKLLGYRYGWGGTADGWDCSSLCQDIFRTMGLYLPRNAGAQRYMPADQQVEYSTAAEKQTRLEEMLPGAMLELKGHQTLYLGMYEGESYVIHATQGVYDRQGGVYLTNSVVVTSVEALRSTGKTLLESFRAFCLPQALSQ